MVETLGVSTPIMELSSADGATNISNPGEAFVDDSFLGSTSSHTDQQDLSFHENQSMHKASAIQNLTQLAQRWERHLFSTEGA